MTTCYDGEWRDEMMRSHMTLKALTHVSLVNTARTLSRVSGGPAADRPGRGA